MTTPRHRGATLHRARVRGLHKTLAASLKKIRAIGYTAVQVSGIGPIPHADVKTMLDDAGLVCCITHIPYERLWHDLPERHRTAPALEARRHRPVHAQSYRADGEAGFRRFAQEANRVGETLSRVGLTFSYHNHSFEFVRFGQQTGLDLLLRGVDPRYLKAELDTYWVQHGGGDPSAWIRKMTGRMPVVHLKDMVMVEGGQDKRGPASCRRWPRSARATSTGTPIQAAVEEAGVEWYAIEQDVCRRDPFDSLRISYDNLRAMGLE